MRRYHLLAYALILFCLVPCQAFAWGELGHALIAMASAQLLRNEPLKKFLGERVVELSYLSNVPDIYWRNLPEGKVGEGAHFVNPQNTKIDVSKIPLSWKAFVKKVGQKDTDVAGSIGSLWWRADQFERRAQDSVKLAKASEEGSDAYTAAIFDMLANMGIQAHFPGDASQPLHNNSDYDGWTAGHGGFHSYYESDLVNALGMSLLPKIVARTNELIAARDPLTKKGTLLSKMRSLSTFSSKQLPELLALDKISAPSDQATKKKAARAPAAEMAATFEPYLIDQMARSVLVLSQSWDNSYEAGGKPSFEKYRSYQWPHTPAYIPPDYVSTPPPPAPATKECKPGQLIPKN